MNENQPDWQITRERDETQVLIKYIRESTNSFHNTAIYRLLGQSKVTIFK